MGVFFDRLSILSRKKKLKLFWSLMRPGSKTKILDVGAEVNQYGGRQLQLIDSYEWKQNITAVNNFPAHIESIREHYPEIDAVVADACDLPWPDKHFDIVYSNAVIEHVGDHERQKRMADEIMRVGRNWFVTTPNRWYPFEFHLRLPLVTWLPGKLYLRAGWVLSYNHVKKQYVFGNDTEDLNLLSASRMKRLFPHARIIRQRVTFLPETLIVIGGDSLDS